MKPPEGSGRGIILRKALDASNMSGARGVQSSKLVKGPNSAVEWRGKTMGAILRKPTARLVTVISALSALLAAASLASAQAPSGPLAPRPGQSAQRAPQQAPQRSQDQS